MMSRGVVKFSEDDIVYGVIHKSRQDDLVSPDQPSSKIVTRSQAAQAGPATLDASRSAFAPDDVRFEKASTKDLRGPYIGRLKSYVTDLQNVIGANRRLSKEKTSKPTVFESKDEQIKQLEMQLKLSRDKRDLLTQLTRTNSIIEKGETERRQLHNKVMDLKGNIRVFCRLKPSLNDGVISSQDENVNIIHNGNKCSFTFDRVFTSQMSQEDVYMEISELVQSVMDGYKVCIFAYGQTGSGKTYTMMGKPELPDQRGLIPRALEQVFKTKQTLESQGWKYEMKVSALEIYLEAIRDLLASQKSTGAEMKCEITLDENHNTFVKGLTSSGANSFSEVSNLLRTAARRRSVGETKMNERSSRSHFVFTLRINGVNESTNEQVQGVLNLIDLAGAESYAASAATGDRFKEAKAINSSLLVLRNVISALANKVGCASFRTSKLTHLLKDCLSGDSKTLMFVNVSTDPASVDESFRSLQFARTVSSCEIGSPRQQTNLRHG